MRALPQELQDQPYEPPLEPHTVLPVQYYTARERRRARNSEERLMFAILEDAVNVFCNYREPSSKKQRRAFLNTQRWIESNDRTWLFSYLRICEVLDLDAEYLRSGMRRRRASNGTRRQPIPLRTPAPEVGDAVSWGQRACGSLRLV